MYKASFIQTSVHINNTSWCQTMSIYTSSAFLNYTQYVYTLYIIDDFITQNTTL